MSGICSHRPSGRQDTYRRLKLVKILAMAKKEGMTSWLAKIHGRHFHQAKSRHLRPLVAKVASPALSVVCVGDSLQITCKREALQKINWNERPKAMQGMSTNWLSGAVSRLWSELANARQHFSWHGRPPATLRKAFLSSDLSQKHSLSIAKLSPA